MLPNYRLASAVRRGCIHDIHEAINDGATLEKPDITSLPLLELAQKHGQLEAARVLLKLGADPVPILSRHGDTLIHKAIRSKQPGFVSLWLENGVSGERFNDRGEAPIHLAARHGEQFVIDQLRSSGASVSQEDEYGRTPIMYAAEAGQTSTAKYLIGLGADPLLPDGAGVNAFQIATRNHHAACCHAMLEAYRFFPEERDSLLCSLSDITKKFGYADAQTWIATESKADQSANTARTEKRNAGRSPNRQRG